MMMTDNDDLWWLMVMIMMTDQSEWRQWVKCIILMVNDWTSYAITTVIICVVPGYSTFSNRKLLKSGMHTISKFSTLL